MRKIITRHLTRLLRQAMLKNIIQPRAHPSFGMNANTSETPAAGGSMNDGKKVEPPR